MAARGLLWSRASPHAGTAADPVRMMWSAALPADRTGCTRQRLEGCRPQLGEGAGEGGLCSRPSSLLQVLDVVTLTNL